MIAKKQARAANAGTNPPAETFLFPWPTEYIGVDGGTAWKFESIANALINQDMGCLNQTFSLVATALSFVPCALGSVNVGQLDTALGLDCRKDPCIEVFTLRK